MSSKVEVVKTVAEVLLVVGGQKQKQSGKSGGKGKGKKAKNLNGINSQQVPNLKMRHLLPQ